MSDTPTPETDAAVRITTTLSNRCGLARSEYDGGKIDYVQPDFARELERQRDELKAHLAEACRAFIPCGFPKVHGAVHRDDWNKWRKAAGVTK